MKITDYPEATVVNDEDVFLISSVGQVKKVTGAKIRESLETKIEIVSAPSVNLVYKNESGQDCINFRNGILEAGSIGKGCLRVDPSSESQYFSIDEKYDIIGCVNGLDYVPRTRLKVIDISDTSVGDYPVQSAISLEDFKKVLVWLSFVEVPTANNHNRYQINYFYINNSDKTLGITTAPKLQLVVKKHEASNESE